MKPIVSTENMARNEWLEWRRKGIGGSDVSIICGINKYKSPLELWLDKTNQLEPQESGESAYWGRVLEPVVRAEFVKRTGLSVTQIPYIFQHPQYDFMLANLDGLIYDPASDKSYIFEAKTASQYIASDWDMNIPEAYQLQVQHYMAVTNLPGAYVAVLIGGNQFKYFFIERDEAIISLLISIEKTFWDQVTSLTPPDIDGSKASTEFLNKLFPVATQEDSSLELPETAMELISEHERVDKEIDELTKQKDMTINRLKEMLGSHSKGIIGHNQVIWNNIKTDRLDTKLLKQEQPDIYQQYLNTVNYRRFSIK